MNKKEIKKLKNKETHLPLEDAVFLLGSVVCMVLLKIPWRSLWKLGCGPLKSATYYHFSFKKNLTISKCNLLPLFFQKISPSQSATCYHFSIKKSLTLKWQPWRIPIVWLYSKKKIECYRFSFHQTHSAPHGD